MTWNGGKTTEVHLNITDKQLVKVPQTAGVHVQFMIERDNNAIQKMLLF